MAKFLSIPVHTEGEQLISLQDILTITSPSQASTEVVITYMNGTVVTINSDAQSNYNQRDKISEAVLAALNFEYLGVSYEPVLPKVVSSIVIT